jgi:hypothetical protein
VITSQDQHVRANVYPKSGFVDSLFGYSSFGSKPF